MIYFTTKILYTKYRSIYLFQYLVSYSTLYGSLIPLITYETILPASFLTAGDASKTVEIKTDIAAVTVPVNMLNTADTAGAQNVSLTIATGDKSKLDAAVQAQISDRPIIDINLKAVGFIAGRGITTGTGNENYSPESKLTRGEFIVMMMRAYGIEPDRNPKDNFADAGSTWYTGYLSTAKRLDISGGVGNNMFEPGQEITRQEMFTLLYNALKVIGSLPKGTYGKALSDFSDANEIASWAKDAMTLMVGTGTISGNGGKISPASTTTRAEMAQVLYNLLSK